MLAFFPHERDDAYRISCVCCFALLFTLTNEVPYVIESWVAEMVAIKRGGTVQDSRFFQLGDVLNANAAIMLGLLAAFVSTVVARSAKSQSPASLSAAEQPNAAKPPVE